MRYPGRIGSAAILAVTALAAGTAVAGPAGTAGYEAVEHRGWIKRHILHVKPHRPKQG